MTRAIKNMRWNESPIFALNNIDAMTPPERVVSGEGVGGSGFAVVCPAARIREFTFSSGLRRRLGLRHAFFSVRIFSLASLA